MPYTTDFLSELVQVYGIYICIIGINICIIGCFIGVQADNTDLIAKFLYFACFFVKLNKRLYGAILFAVTVLEEEVSVRLSKQ